MPIKMVFDSTLDDGGGHVPRFFCDYCGKVIEDAAEGLVCWGRKAGEDSLPDVAELEYFAHRGVCDETLEAAARGKGLMTMWEGLLEFPIHLANNSTPAARKGQYIVAPTRKHPMKDFYPPVPDA